MGFVLLNLKDDGSRRATPADFARLQAVLTGTDEAPLWRSLLAEAHRYRAVHLRDVVVRCATALDVGIQVVSSTVKVNVELFRGDGKRVDKRNKTPVRTPDLRLTDQALFIQIERLWYTRHGVVHRGQVQLYEGNPQHGARPLRPLTAADVDGFLVAVPRAVEFVTNNPP